MSNWPKVGDKVIIGDLSFRIVELDKFIRSVYCWLALDSNKPPVDALEHVEYRVPEDMLRGFYWDSDNRAWITHQLFPDYVEMRLNVDANGS